MRATAQAGSSPARSGGMRSGDVAGKEMRTYHEWMKSPLLVTLSGNPALVVPAGFGAAGLPIGLQIVGPNRGEIACLQLAKAYEAAAPWVEKRPPAQKA